MMGRDRAGRSSCNRTLEAVARWLDGEALFAEWLVERHRNEGEQADVFAVASGVALRPHDDPLVGLVVDPYHKGIGRTMPRPSNRSLGT